MVVYSQKIDYTALAPNETHPPIREIKIAHNL
jgi:hypothetical protein